MKTGMTRSLAMILPSVLAILGTFAPPVYADEDAGRRSVFAQGAGNRALAMGGAFVAISDDASAPLWNPGGLGFITRKQFQVSRTSMYGLDIREEYLGFVMPNWRFGTGAVTLRHIGVGGIEGRDDRNVVTDDDLSDGETEFTMSYGRAVTDALSMGATAKLHRQSLAGFNGSSFGLDLGLVGRPGVLWPEYSWMRNLSVGLAFRNLIDSSMQLDLDRIKDPSTARGGLAFSFPLQHQRSVLVGLDVEKGPAVDTHVRLGLEARIHPLVAMRMGLNQSGMTVGAGIRWHDFSFDYAFEDDSFDSAHRLGLSWIFGATTQESRLQILRAEEETLQARLEEAFARRQTEHINQLLSDASQARFEGRVDDALDLVAVVTTLDPENKSAMDLHLACLLDQAHNLETRGSFAEAAVVYGQILTMAPDNTTAVAENVRCRAQSDERAARSQEIRVLFAEALEALSAGDLATARSGFEKVLIVEPEDEEAATLLSRTEQTIDKRVSALLGQTDRFIEVGLLKEAAATLAEAKDLGVQTASVRRVESGLAKAHRLAAGTSTQSDSPTGASATQAASSLKPGEVEELYKRGMAAMEAGKTNDALNYWELVVSADPTYQQVTKYLKQEYLARGMDSFAEGRLEQAINYWEKALRADPGDGKVQGYLARARQQLSRSREILGSGQ